MKSLFQRLSLLMSALTAICGSGASAADNGGKLRLTIVSFNIRVPVDPPPNDWATRKKRAIADIRRMKPDLFGLQEAVPQQIADLETLGYLHIGHGRERDLKGEASPVFYDPRRFEVVESRTVWLSKTPQVYSLAEGASLPRIVTVGIFREKAGGRKFVFANTHLHHRNHEICHPEQMRAILDELEPYIRRGMTVFLTGDFNSFPTGVAYKMAAEVLCDAYLKSEKKPVMPHVRTSHGFGRILQKPGDRIDYIWTTPDVRVLRYESVNNFDDQGLASSDHYPQLSEVDF